MPNPTADVVDYLDTNSTQLTEGTNLFHGPVRAYSTAGAPAQAVFVMASGGRPPNRIFGLASEMRYPNVFVRTRSNDLQTGQTLARNIHNILQSASVTNYEDVQALQSEPTFMGQDTRGLYEWSDGFRVVYNSTG